MKNILIASSVVLISTVVASIFIPLNSDDFRKESIHSLKVLDRNGKILREYLNDEQGRGEWIPKVKISQYVIDATLVVEDKRFYSHPGIDPIAIARALYENIFLSARTGGSTVTQQMIRTIYHYPRTLKYKILEAWYALRLERMMSKEEILEQYFNRAPYGNQLNGIQAAAKYYFNKPASELSIAEAAFLSALPNAPTLLNPYKNYDETVKRQKKILRRMLEEQYITESEYKRAVQQPIPVVTPDKKFKAPHAVELVYTQVMKSNLFLDSQNRNHAQSGTAVMLSETKNLPEAWEPLPSSADRSDSSLRAEKNVGVLFSMIPERRPAEITTTIDLELQSDIQWIVRGHLAQLKKKHVTNAAVVVLHNATGEVRTLIGSADYFNASISGNVNGALALRQPGSAMKPFTYAIALESGFTPSTLLADVPTSLPAEGGDYVPENYDREFHGPVRLRTALACSYNIPAVRVLYTVGRDALFGKLLQAGITSLDKSPQHYGYGLTLGNAEVTLIELTNAYRIFANNGVWNPIKLVLSTTNVSGMPVSQLLDIENGIGRKVFSEEAAYLISNILKDPVARRPAFGNHFRFSFPCAVKTGTTKDYKDNWAIGFTTEYTVGVWTGNFDSKPMLRVSGVSGAGQIFTDIMNLIMTKYSSDEKDFFKPKSIVTRTVCSRSGKLPSMYCERTIQEQFVRNSVPTQQCDIHRSYYVKQLDGTFKEKIFEIFPPEYQSWVKLENLPQPPKDARDSKVTYRQTAMILKPAIIFPHSGDVFKIDPVLRKEYQKIKIETLLPSALRNAHLFVNGTETIPIESDGTWWQLRKGEHVMQVIGTFKKWKISSRKIKILVE
jgi:penicillin-binding protein 1C